MVKVFYFLLVNLDERESDVYNKDFAFILKKLKANPGEKGIKILIPDSLLFQGNSPKLLVYTDKDLSLKFVNNKKLLINIKIQ